MSLSSDIQRSKLNSKTAVIGSLILVATLLGLPVWKEYLQGGFLFYLTIALGPYILYVQQKGVASSRYAWASIFAALGHLYLGMNILFLAAYLFFLLFLVEWKWGKLNSLSLYWIFMLSPLTIFLFSVFSFPIRLELSHIASSLLQFIQPNLTCEGNLIVMNDVEFSVDAVCMGLKMVSYSYLVILLFIAQMEQKSQVFLPKPIIFGLLSIGTIFILFANLIRIMTIIMVQAMPETIAHEIIGILTWLIYVILPSFFLVKALIKKWGIPYKNTTSNTISSALVIGLITSSLTLLALSGYRTLVKDKTPPTATLPVLPQGFQQQIAEDGVVQLKNEEVLIYIKPACPPYRADHAPNICWKGSGYAFSKEVLQKIGATPVVSAQLQKGEDILYTAWWYSNGIDQTNSQLEWRWNALKGKGNYQLLNVTVEDPALLEKYVRLLAE